MTKKDLIEFLQIFTDDIEILVADGTHAPYRLAAGPSYIVCKDGYGYAVIGQGEPSKVVPVQR